MSRKKVLLAIVVIGLVLVIWQFDKFFEWNINRKWKSIPEFIVHDNLARFESDCSPFYQIFGFSSVTLVENELSEAYNNTFSSATNYIVKYYSEPPYNFNFPESKQYSFRCKHGQYLLVWHIENYGTNCAAYTTAHIDSNIIWQIGGVTSYAKE